MLVQQHVDVVGFRQAVRTARAQHRREAQLGQRTADHLGQGREDGVPQLGEDQADQPGAAAPQFGGTFVTEDVKRGEDCGAGSSGNARAAIEDATDRCFAYPYLFCNLCEPVRHRLASLRQTLLHSAMP